MTEHNTITLRTPGGEELVLLSRAAYEELLDRLDSAEAALTLADIRAGRDIPLPTEDMDAFLAAPSALAFWRAKRGLSQAALSRAARVSPPYLSDLEAGRRKGSPATLLRLAKQLRLPMELLVDDAEDPAEAADR